MELQNALNWFEIPVTDFNRAKKFYETIFDFQMPESQMGPARMGFLLYDFQSRKVGGAIVHQQGFHVPSQTGSLIYLNCNPDLQTVLDKVENAGGKVRQQKMPVSREQPELGHWALIHDTEGNRIALHSNS
jgi:predicted enzyme related to lactoylglutathione lyase